MPSVALAYDDRYLDHDTGDHPECAERLRAIVSGLRENGFWEQLVHLRARSATADQVAYVHRADYVKMIRERAEQEVRYLDFDTSLSPASYDVALLASGGLLSCIDYAVEGEGRRAFGLVRPPGHHAGPGIGMGFCLFNNIAIATRYAQKEKGLKRAAILDWDAHHGNGTQATFYEDPSVLYASIHQYPHYPGSGAHEDTGSGPGEGTTLNVPLPAGSGDGEYLGALQGVVSDAVRAFRPDMILLSAGFDAHEADSLASMNVTTEGFRKMTYIAASLADELCSGRLVSALEGGYDLKALTDSVEAHLRALGAE